jgi:DNA invertase Pin-like site-specific DNA recombinase
VSSVEQAAEDRSSLDVQLRVCEAAATIAKLPAPVPVVDPGVSGSIPLAERPEGGKMVAALQPGDTVIAAKLDRLFRSAVDALSSVESLKAQGVKLILVDIGTEPVTESAVAKMFLGILASVAEFEKNRILDRMATGRIEKRKSGGHIGGKPPYGFRKVGAGKSARLEPDEDECAVIEAVRQMRSGGASFRSISSRLAERGVLSRTGAEFAPTQIKRMLADCTGAGS